MGRHHLRLVRTVLVFRWFLLNKKSQRWNAEPKISPEKRIFFRSLKQKTLEKVIGCLRGTRKKSPIQRHYSANKHFFKTF